MENNQENNYHHDIMASHGAVKKAAVVALSFLSLFLLAAAIGEFEKLPTIGKDLPVINTINVSGTGEVVAVPDIATFTFGVSNESLNVGDAQTKSAQAINDITNYLTTNGVDKSDIKTTGYNIYPRYEYSGTFCPAGTYCPPSGKQTLAAYVVSQNVEVKVRKIADAGKLLGGLGELGATDISGLTFSFDKDTDLKNQARADAISQAKTQAESIAKSLGVSLGRVVSFNENNGYPIVYGMGGSVAMSAKAPAPSPEVTPGESKITSTVNVTYEIR